MRVDKYLWCVRYYKTRNIATNACKKGHVRVNGDIAKPSRDVYISDRVVLRKNQINHQLIVNDIPASRIGAKLVDIYRKDVTPKDEFSSKELLKYNKDFHRNKGDGRPTKKERRDIDDYYSQND